MWTITLGSRAGRNTVATGGGWGITIVRRMDWNLERRIRNYMISGWLGNPVATGRASDRELYMSAG